MKPDRIPSTDHPPLDERQCLRLLAATRIGRVVYTVGALPAVLPTRYRLGPDGSVLFSAAAGSELVRAVSGALVAFEAGEVSESDGSGWSVTVLGRADVTGAPGTGAPGTGVPAPYDPVLPPHPGQVSIRIRAELVTGRLLPDARACRT